MPRRLPIRTAKVIGNMFVLLVFIVIGFIYFTFMKVWLSRVKGKFQPLTLTFI